MTNNFMALVPKIDKIGYDGCDVQAIKGQGAGGRVLAIPHNGNLSNGWMFADVTQADERYSVDYLQRRKRWEPLVEISQIKSDSETHPLFSPNDEFADDETAGVGNLDLSQSKTDAMLRFEYVRETLKRGVTYESEQGSNRRGHDDNPGANLYLTYLGQA